MVALGWTLLHFCWQGTVLALLYVLADRLTLRSETRVRYGIAMVALLWMPVAAAATFLEQTLLTVHVLRNGQDVAASQLGPLHAMVIHDIPFAAPVVTRGEVWIAWNADRILPFLDAIWVVGVLLLAVRAIGGWVQLEQFRRRARCAVPVELEASFHRILERLQVGRKVVLRVSDEVISPLAMGAWRTVVVLPLSAVMQLEPAQLEAVLAHELAHVRRWDYLCNLLQTAIECLLFFHPAVWWMSRRVRDLREICCDEVAAKSCSDPVIYVEALLRLEEQRAARFELAMALDGNQPGNLLARVKQVLGEGMHMERKAMSGVRVAVAGVVVLSLLVGPKVANGLETATKTLREKLPMAQPALRVMVDDVAKTPRTTAKQSGAAQPDTQQVADAIPVPAVAPMVTPVVIPDVHPMPTVAMNDMQDQAHGDGGQYIDKMREAGYPLDLNKDLDELVSLRALGVTPDYARGMAKAGFGTPTLQELTSLKAIGVTPEYAATMKAGPLAPKDLGELISERSLGVTPEYAKSMAALGLGNPSVRDLISLKAQGVTPEYVAELKASGIGPKDLGELSSMKALGVTPEYAREMAATGFSNLDPGKLVSLRAQGVTPEYVRWVKQTFPSADMHQLEQASVFHINEDFMAKAKAHGFNSTDLDKLVKLKITGLLD